jgi:hypothetical protein
MVFNERVLWDVTKFNKCMKSLDEMQSYLVVIEPHIESGQVFGENVTFMNR